MKRLLSFSGIAFAAILMMASCGSKKNTVVQTSDQMRNIEGEVVNMEWVETSGIDMVETLSDDGTKMVTVPYKWFSGTAKADDRGTAIEMAELEARATVSRVIENAVLAESKRNTVANNGNVQKALQSHWSQISASIQNACEPMSDTKVEYNPTTKMYTVTSKVGIRGDRFQQMLNNAGNYKPANLSGDDLQQFNDANNSIIRATRGK